MSNLRGVILTLKGVEDPESQKEIVRDALQLSISLLRSQETPQQDRIHCLQILSQVICLTSDASFHIQSFLTMLPIWTKTTHNTEANECKNVIRVIVEQAHSGENEELLSSLIARISQSELYDKKNLYILTQLLTFALRRPDINFLGSKTFSIIISHYGASDAFFADLIKLILGTNASSLAGQTAAAWYLLTENYDLFNSIVLKSMNANDHAASVLGLNFWFSVFEKRPTVFSDLYKSLGILNEGRSTLLSSIAETEVLRAADRARLLRVGSFAGAFTWDKIDVLLKKRHPSTRMFAIALLVQQSSPGPTCVLFTSDDGLFFSKILLAFETSLGELSPEFQMEFLTQFSKLLINLKDNARKMSTKQISTDNISDFLRKLISFFGICILPGRAYRVQQAALRFIELMSVSGLDTAFNMTRDSRTHYSFTEYRKTPKTTIPLRLADKTLKWPFSLTLFTPEIVFSLLCSMRSTYTSVRDLSLGLLESVQTSNGDIFPGFPASRLEADLVQPAMSLIDSGRDADASTGALVLGLLWRRCLIYKVHEERVRQLMTEIFERIDVRLTAYEKDIISASKELPLHGSVIALRTLLVGVPVELWTSVMDDRSWRQAFHRMLAMIERIWHVTAPVLASAAPEGDSNTADNEEARALEITLHGDDTNDADDFDADFEENILDQSGTSHAQWKGMQHKVVLSATWRAMKEAGELMECLYRVPYRVSSDTFASIWSYEEIELGGHMFSIWLQRIRHRGGFMALHPCYVRFCKTISETTDRAVTELPKKWLRAHVDDFLTNKISVTRRSAGMPYCIAGLLNVIADSQTFDDTVRRLLQHAGDDTNDLNSRIHMMNTLRVCVLDGDLTKSMSRWYEQCFLTAIDNFWSPHWSLRNASMMLFSSVVVKAFNARRVNLVREPTVLKTRMPYDAFFAHYPRLYENLLKQFPLAHANTSMEMQSGLFAVLLVLSFLRIDVSVDHDYPPERFIESIEQILVSNRVFKIREAAGDALTGLVARDVLVDKVADLIDGCVQEISENAWHGRLVGAARLLRSASALTADETDYLKPLVKDLVLQVHDAHSLPVKGLILSLADIVLSSDETSSWIQEKEAIKGSFITACHDARVAKQGPPGVMSFAQMCLSILKDDDDCIVAALGSHFTDVHKDILNVLQGKPLTESVTKALAGLVTRRDGADPFHRVAAANILVESPNSAHVLSSTYFKSEIMLLFVSSSVSSLREAVFPLVVMLDNPHSYDHFITAKADENSDVDAREASAKALRWCLHHDSGDVSLEPPLSVAAQRLVQDDDALVRDYASKALENLRDGDKCEFAWLSDLVKLDSKAVLVEQCVNHEAEFATLARPSGKLFYQEPANVYKDDLFCFIEADEIPQEVSAYESEFIRSVSQGRGFSMSPLGVLADPIASKWIYIFGKATSSSYLAKAKSLCK